jgi:hypothetical protein
LTRASVAAVLTTIATTFSNLFFLCEVLSVLLECLTTQLSFGDIVYLQIQVNVL